MSVRGSGELDFDEFVDFLFELEPIAYVWGKLERPLITPATSFIEDLDIDSLGMVELYVILLEFFGSDEVADQLSETVFDTVGALFNWFSDNGNCSFKQLSQYIPAEDH